MKRINFDNANDGFFGVYWQNPIKTDAAIISIVGDDTEDYMAKHVVKWAHQRRLNVMTMSISRKNYSYHNYPIERIENAVKWLKDNENSKVAIVGGSTTGMVALVAASLFNDITLTIALSPSDFVWQGFAQGKKDGCKEWPIKGESTLTYKGEPLPYMEFVYQHPEYWQVVAAETKRTKDMISSKKLFDDSEKAHPLTEEQMIKVENIKGTLVLVGAEDDGLWDTAKYIRRMADRLESKPHSCEYHALVYRHGTHFIFPESLLKSMFKFPKLILKLMFQDAKKYPNECLETRKDIDEKLTKFIANWVDGCK